VRDYDVFTVESKADVLEKSHEYWNPGKTGFWVDTGVDLVGQQHFVRVCGVAA